VGVFSLPAEDTVAKLGPRKGRGQVVGVVITLSGAIGSRRSDLAIQLARRLGWPRVKFSDYIKKVIRDDGGDPENRTQQQSYGQKLVQNRLDEFVGNVLAMAPDWGPGSDLLVDGLRHVEVLLTLKNKVAPSKVLYVDVSVDPLRRESGAKERGIAEQMLYRYDRDLTEAQLARILPAYADLKVDGTLGFSINVDEIVQVVERLGGRVPPR
jgi:hypothetical protein